MVTEEKAPSNAVLRYRLGMILIWIGVFTWVPFIFLRASGEKPPFLLFLPFHLLGVVGGSRLRAAARKELGLFPSKKSALLLAAHVAILLGILVWAPYLYLKLALSQPVEVITYLPYHLMGVLVGVLLHGLHYFLGMRSKPEI